MNPEPARMRRRPLLAVLLCLAAASPGCAFLSVVQPWRPSRDATPADVRAALGIGDPSRLDDITPAEVPDIPPRTNTRPCCAFGSVVRVMVGGLPVPGLALDNVRDVADLGPHTYDSGALAKSEDPARSFLTIENDGLVYTCRGGFIDTAHVRDYADWTLFLAAVFARNLERGVTLELADEGGKRRIELRALSPALVRRVGRREAAVALAQYAAFELSVWHEIATWYGWSFLGSWPEYASAFSPEDLYSNLLGTKIAGAIIRKRLDWTSLLYNQAMDAWLAPTLRELGPVPRTAASEAATLVDGVWWDSKARLPDRNLILRRQFEIGATATPWVVSDAYDAPEMQRFVDTHCGGAEEPLPLANPQRLRGIPMRRLVRLEITVSDTLPQRFPSLRGGTRVVTQNDFPALVRIIRAAHDAERGRPSSSPHRDREDDDAPDRMPEALE